MKIRIFNAGLNVVVPLLLAFSFDLNAETKSNDEKLPELKVVDNIEAEIYESRFTACTGLGIGWELASPKSLQKYYKSINKKGIALTNHDTRSDAILIFDLETGEVMNAMKKLDNDQAERVEGFNKGLPSKPTRKFKVVCIKPNGKQDTTPIKATKDY